MALLTPKIVVQPIAEPLELATVYHHLRLDALIDVDSDGNGTRPDDPLLNILINAAREHCEDATGVSLAVKTYAISLSEFPSPFELPRPPFVVMVDATYDGDESDSILVEGQNFTIDTFGDMAKVEPVGSWPTIRAGNRATFTYRAGYGVPGDASDTDALPGWAKLSMLLLIEHWYSNRGATGEVNLTDIPYGVRQMLLRHKVRTGLA